MNVIKPTRIREFSKKNARAASSLKLWLAKAQQAEWKGFADVRETFGNADQVKALSGKKVIVFNIGGNAFRLICAAHFNRGTVFVLRFLTHAEYDKENWKTE